MASMVNELMATVKVLGHDWLKSRDPVRRYREEDISYAEALFLSIGATLKKVSESPQATEAFKQAAALEMAELVEVLKAYKAHRDQTTPVDEKKQENT
jgi:hypothetical protein